MRVKVGTATQGVFSTDGVHTIQLVSNGTTLVIDGLGSYIGSIDNVSVKEVIGGYNKPRLDYSDSSCPSLLLEPQRTNLLPYSEDYSQSVYTRRNCTINQNYAISPSGLVDATLVSANGSDSAIFDNIGVTSGNTYTLSVYLRVENGTLDTTISLGSAGFPNISGDGGRVKDITVTTEWRRFTLTSTADANAGSDVGIIGGFGGFNNGDSVLVYGAQLEEGSYATSYIPTTDGIIKTRLQDECNNAGDSSTFNDSEGVLMVEISALANDITTRKISLSDGSASNALYIGYITTSNSVRALISSAGSAQVKDIVIDITAFNKMAIIYQNNGTGAFWVNGSNVGSINTGTGFNASLSSLQFQREQSGTPEAFYGNTKQVQYYDSVLTDIELEELTSWQSFTAMANSQKYTIK